MAQYVLTRVILAFCVLAGAIGNLLSLTGGANPKPTVLVDSPAVQERLQGRNIWTSLGPFADAVNAIAVAPINTATIYAGVGFQGGAFKSTDLGLTWVRINSGLSTSDNRTATVLALAVNPSDPQIVYAGTRENGVFRSTNGGATWFAINQGLPDRPVHALVVNPQSPAVVCVGLNALREGVYRSTDGGLTWDAADIERDVGIVAFAVHPQMPNRVYAGTDEGVFRSFDGGQTWSPANNGLPRRGGTVLLVPSVAIDPNAPSTVYLGASSSEGLGVFKSTDAGDNWSPMSVGLADLSITGLTTDPNIPNVVYARAEEGGVFRSSDGGNTWTQMNDGLEERSEREITGLMISPGPAVTLFAGTDKRGLFGFSFPGDEAAPTVRNVQLSRKKVKRKVGPNVTISWQSEDDVAVITHDVDFASDGVNFDRPLASGLPGTEMSFVWTVPSTLPKTTTGVIRVTARDASGKSSNGVSRVFTIK